MEKEEDKKEDDLVDMQNPDDTPTILYNYKPKQKFILLILVLVIAIIVITIMLIVFVSMNKDDDKKEKGEKGGKGGKDEKGGKGGKGEKGKCVTGEGNCLKCDEATNTCVACELGYKLEDGECILYHSFKAVYKTDKKDQKINLIAYFGKYDILDIMIDGAKTEV